MSVQPKNFGLHGSTNYKKYVIDDFIHSITNSIVIISIKVFIYID